MSVGDLREFGELHGISHFGFLSKTIPRGHSVELNFAGVGGGLEIDEGIAHALEKIRGGDFTELRFRIVQVIDVDAIDLQVAEAAAKLILEKARRHAVAARDDVFGGEHAGLKVLAEKIFVGILGHGAVWSQVAALGANHELVARKSFCCKLFDGRTDVALAALKTVVNGCVDKIDAAFGCRDDRCGVTRIDLRIGLAEIGADSERRHHQPVGFAKVAIGGASGKSVGVALCSFQCGGIVHGVLCVAATPRGHGMPCPYKVNGFTAAVDCPSRRVRLPGERAGANRHGESYGMASPFRERKSRRREDYCSTSGR